MNIWNANTKREVLDSSGLSSYEEGDMGPMYGCQWRHFGAKYEGCNADYTEQGIDQLSECINLIRNDPHSRRIIMTTFNPAQVNEGCLYPCHGISIQFYVESLNNISGDNPENNTISLCENKLSCMMTQRSGDLFLGVPYNIASYALLVHMMCEIISNSGMKIVPGRLIIVLGDVHIYETHKDQATKQISRDPYNFPFLKFNKKVENIEDFKFENVELCEYNHHPGIKAEMIA